MVKIIFHLQHFDYRGTGQVIYDYAHYNETILKNQSIITIQKNIDYKKNYSFVVERFYSRFIIYLYEDLNDLQNYCLKNNITHFYALKYGKNDGIFLQPPIKNLIHCVYTTSEPHGDGKYFGVSETIDPNNYLYHIVKLYDTDENLRKELNIGDNEVVFGRHGGIDTFSLVDCSVLLKAIETLGARFIFMPKPLTLKDFNHPKIIYLEPTVDPIFKRKFINTCDAMFHFSLLGESFGLSVMEFSYCNRPVITYNGGDFVGRKNQQHLNFLGNKALLYDTESELFEHIKNICQNKNKFKDNKIDILNQLTPEKIMQDFNKLIEEKININKIIKNYKNFNQLNLATI